MESQIGTNLEHTKTKDTFHEIITQLYHGKCWFVYQFVQLVLTQSLLVYAILDITNFTSYTEFITIEIITIQFVLIDISLKIILFKRDVCNFCFVQDVVFLVLIFVILGLVVYKKKQEAIFEDIDIVLLTIRYLIQGSRCVYIGVNMHNENIKRRKSNIVMGLGTGSEMTDVAGSMNTISDVNSNQNSSDLLEKRMNPSFID